ncbi:MAG: SPOR domain-containing protein [Ignavibacteriaceae bacterium]
MTKAELIRKLARKNGVPDSEAKVFFEIFLQHLSSLLAPGEAINIDDLGFFQLRKGKIKNSNPPADKENKAEVYSDLIICTPTQKESDNSGEMLIFNVPAVKTMSYNVVDSYFSLSAGKPIIPLRGVKNTEFFIPPSGTELRRLLETKVDNLVSQSEVVKNYKKGNEYLFISPESYNADQFEINWGEFSDKQKETEETGIESIPWDFGEDISKQIEEESILDIEKDESLPPIVNESVSWDFGSEYLEDHITSPDEQKKLQDSDEQPKNFKRVKSFTKEHPSQKSPGLITRSEENLSWSFGEAGEKKPEETNDDQFYKKHYVEPVPDEKGFTEVINKRKTYDIELSNRDQARLDSIIKEELQKGEEPDSEDVSSGFYKEEKQPEPKKETISSSSYKKEYYSRRRSTPVFIIALFVISAVAAALFIFLKESTQLNVKEGEHQALIAKPSVPTVIDRNYDVPVTYPYQKRENLSGISLPTAKVSEPVPQKQITAGNEVENVTPKSVTRSSPEAVTRPSSGSVKLKNNLYREGNTYTVQISSWKSKSKAEAEVQKLRNKNLDAFVERAEVPGKGFWYRVKIGNIKTQAEAEKYLIE